MERIERRAVAIDKRIYDRLKALMATRPGGGRLGTFAGQAIEAAIEAEEGSTIEAGAAGFSTVETN
jgi:hypothetical protein